MEQTSQETVSLSHFLLQNRVQTILSPAYTHYNYPGYYESQDFHYCNNGNDNNIENYDNRTEVQECQLDGLAE